MSGPVKPGAPPAGGVVSRLPTLVKRTKPSAPSPLPWLEQRREARQNRRRPWLQGASMKTPAPRLPPTPPMSPVSRLNARRSQRTERSRPWLLQTGSSKPAVASTGHLKSALRTAGTKELVHQRLRFVEFVSVCEVDKWIIPELHIFDETADQEDSSSEDSLVEEFDALSF